MYSVGSHSFWLHDHHQTDTEPAVGSVWEIVWCTASSGRRAQSCSCSRWNLFTEVLWGTRHHKRSCHESVQFFLKEHLWYIETVLWFLHKVYLSVRLFLVYKTSFELDKENEYLRFTDTRSDHAFRLFCGQSMMGNRQHDITLIHFRGKWRGGGEIRKICL